MADKTDESGPTSPRLGHRPALDGLRAVAIALVLWHHSLAMLLPGRFVHVLGGYLGVDVFFVLSGFLITTILFERREEDGLGSLGGFYRRRAVRLLPALVAFLAVDLLVGLAAHRDMARELRTVGAALTYTSNWAPTLGWDLAQNKLHLWSLAVEEQFYLVWPLLLLSVIARLRFRTAAWCIALAVVGVAVWRVWLTLHYGAGYPIVYQRFDARFDSLLVGAGTALVWRRGWRPSPRGATAAIAVGGLVLALAVGHPAPVPDAAFYGGFTVVALAVAAIIIGVLHSDGVATRVLSWSPLVALGQLSYSLYLWHVLAFGLVAALIPDGVLVRFVVAHAVALAVAVVSYVGIERPLLAPHLPRGATAERARGPLVSVRPGFGGALATRTSAAVGATVAALALATVGTAGGIAARVAVERRVERETELALGAVTTTTTLVAPAAPGQPPTTVGEGGGSGGDGGSAEVPPPADAPPDEPADDTGVVGTVLSLEPPALPAPSIGGVQTLTVLVARLTTVDGQPLAGRTVAFALEVVGDHVQQCNATTDASGAARCSIPVSSGAAVLSATARFVGDAAAAPSDAIWPVNV